MYSLLVTRYFSKLSRDRGRTTRRLSSSWRSSTSTAPFTAAHCTAHPLWRLHTFSSGRVTNAVSDATERNRFFSTPTQYVSDTRNTFKGTTSQNNYANLEASSLHFTVFLTKDTDFIPCPYPLLIYRASWTVVFIRRRTWAGAILPNHNTTPFLAFLHERAGAVTP